MLFLAQFICCQLSHSKHTCAVSWLNAEALEKASTPLLNRLIRYFAHGCSFVALQYSCWIEQLTLDSILKVDWLACEIVAVHYKFQLENLKPHFSSSEVFNCQYFLLGKYSSTVTPLLFPCGSSAAFFCIHRYSCTDTPSYSVWHHPSLSPFSAICSSLPLFLSQMTTLKMCVV